MAAVAMNCFVVRVVAVGYVQQERRRLGRIVWAVCATNRLPFRVHRCEVCENAEAELDAALLPSRLLSHRRDPATRAARFEAAGVDMSVGHVSPAVLAPPSQFRMSYSGTNWPLSLS